MNDSLVHGNLVEMLRTFSKDEVKEFDKFVRSPFHNNRNEVTRLWTELKKYYPSFDQKNFTKEKIFNRLYGGERFRNDVLSRLGSNLKSLIENYFSFKHFSENVFEKKLSLAESLYERNLDKLLDKKLESCEDTIKSNVRLSLEYFYDKFRLCELKQNFYWSRKKINSMIDNNIVMLDSLIYYFLCQLFEILNNNIMQENDFKVKSSSGIKSAFMKSFNADKLADEIKNLHEGKNKLLLALSYLNRALQNPEEESVQLRLEELLSGYSDKFERYTSITLYNVLLSVYSLNIRNGNSSYYRKKFELYKDIINKNLLIPNDSQFVDVIHFVNIFSEAAKLKEFQWAEEFLEKYIAQTNPDERNDIYNYGKATISYYRKEYDRALEFIMKVKFVFFKYSAKSLLCKIYYDMGYTEQLFSFIDSYRHYLNNDKGVPKDIKANHLNYLLNLNKLAKIKFNNDHNSLPKLEKSISEGPHVGKEWLLEKIDELMNKQK